ncbi:cysteine proteinase inhibitor [Acrasis kona]|uniref:Cysteine proteinase inhibitor n=1 Tax=Acrasis kona TaxID=1008807 RepID=A0AAW2Z314_9EUKA
MSKLTIAVLFALIAVLLALPGGKKPHEGELTPDMKKAIELVVQEVSLQHNETTTLVEVISVHYQIVAGKIYHMKLRVSRPTTGKYDLDAMIAHDLEGSLEILQIHEHHQEGGHHEHEEMSADMRKAMNMALRFLSAKHGEVMKITKVVSVHSQIVAGTNYHFVLQIEGVKHDLHEATVVVHHNLDDAMEVIIVKDEHIKSN